MLIGLNYLSIDIPVFVGKLHVHLKLEKLFASGAHILD